MKKVLFLQNNGKSFGGVWQVNKLIGEKLCHMGYEVWVVSIRQNQTNLVVEHDEKLHVHTINETDEWGTYNGNNILNEVKKGHILYGFKMVVSRSKYYASLKKDIKNLHDFIYNYNPDYIISTQYQLLDMIPEKYLPVTIHEQHSSFMAAINHKATRKTFLKYKDKVKFVWLTKTTLYEAIKFGIKNSTCIYNAVRFESKETADVINNKKLITVTRISKDKNILTMVDIVKEVFKDKKFSDWKFEIYGSGDETPKVESSIEGSKQIKLMGRTDDPKKSLLSASIHLNTSPYEGFSLSILEANECGVPTIAFNFGESTEEEIIDGKTGIIAKDKEDYINKLKELMSNENKLRSLSKNCKEFNKTFTIDNIIKNWISLFNEIDKR
jgi:glycosyltransferase involved in cell wall biosynthesis